MRKIGDFQCFEDFWTVLGKAERPSQIHARGGLFFFRKDVQPSPEDPLNKFGNRYTITFKVEAKDEEGNRKVETKFLHILMTVLGRNFQYCERITGVILQSLMTEVKVSIWSMKMEKEEQDIFEGHIQHTLGKKMKVEKKTIV